MSKAWTDHELKLPVFYCETLARLLVLERYRNLIETNISAGAALYTDHKPGLLEESLSNKGQLSAWRIAETADLQSIVEHHYRQGSKMLLADPLSRICAPSSGFYDSSLPSKFQALAKFLPEGIKKMRTVRLYANKDTAALSRHVQAWRTPTNPISQGRLASGSFTDDSTVFYLGICQAEKSIEEIKQLFASDKQFAILMPAGLILEISREENSGGLEVYNPTLEKQVHDLSKVVFSQEGETWLVRVNNQPRIVEVLLAEQVGCNESEISDIFITSIEELIELISVKPDWQEHNSEAAQKCEVHLGEVISPRTTRRSSRLKKVSTTAPPKHIASENQTTDANVGSELDDPMEPSGLEPIEINSSKSTFNQFKIEPIKSWIGKQLKNQDISPAILNNIIETHDNYPDGLLAIPSNKGGPPRLIVPVTAQENLIKQAHLDIHHQSHREVHNILYPLYWWPRMDRDIERVCKACTHFQSGKTRREKIKSEFDAFAPQSKAGPRQHYGILPWSSEGRNPCDCGSLHTRNDLTMVTNQKTRASRANSAATNYI